MHPSNQNASQTSITAHSATKLSGLLLCIISFRVHSHVKGPRKLHQAQAYGRPVCLGCGLGLFISELRYQPTTPASPTLVGPTECLVLMTTPTPSTLPAHDYSITIEVRELQPRQVNNKVIKGGRHGNYQSTCCLGNHYPTSMETTSLPAVLETTTRLAWKLPQSTCCLGNHYPTSIETTSLPAVLETTYRLPLETTSLPAVLETTTRLPLETTSLPAVLETTTRLPLETTSLPTVLETTTRLPLETTSLPAVFLPQSSCCLGNHYPTSRTVRLDPLSLRTPPLTPSRPLAADTAAEGWTLSGDGHQGPSTDVVRACPTHHLGCQGVSNTPPRLSGRVQHTTSAVRACPTHHLGCEGVSNTPPRL